MGVAKVGDMILVARTTTAEPLVDGGFVSMSSGYSASQNYDVILV
jgi:hypothetical protein